MSERIERHLDLLSKYPPTPFAYDPAMRVFEIGNDFVPLSQYDSYEPMPAVPISQEQAYELVSTTNLAVGIFGNHFQMPNMFNWLKSLDNHALSSVQENITETMIEAYKELDERPLKLEKGTHWGFGMGMLRPGHPILNVLGDCACYGVEVHGKIFSEQDWEDGFSEYGLHNIDWQAQKVALFAGVGALAHICEVEINS